MLNFTLTMNKSDDLFDLIQSMTSGEKRLFTLQAKRYKGDKNYLELFKILDEEKSYDEERILKKLKKKGADINFSRLKSYLYEQVINSLEQTHQSTEADFYKQLIRVDLLNSKGLHEQAGDIVDKLKNKGDLQGQEKFDLLILLMRWEYYFIGYKVKKSGKYTFTKEFHGELDTYLNTLLNESLYKEIFNRINGYHWSKRTKLSLKEHAEIKSLTNNELFSDPSKALSINAKKAFYYSLLLSSKLTNDFSLNDIENYLNGYITVSEKEKEYSIDSYLHSILLCSDLALHFKLFVVYEKCLNIIQKTLSELENKKEFTKTDINNIIRGFSSILNYYNIRKNSLKAEKFLKLNSYVEQLDKSKAEIRNLTNYYGILASYYCLTKDFKTLLKLTSNLLQHKTGTEIDLEFTFFCRALQQIACIELNEDYLFESAYRSTKNMLSKYENRYEEELMIFEQINNVKKANTRSEKRNELIKLKLLLESDSQKSDHNAIFGELRFWVNEKLEGKSV